MNRAQLRLAKLAYDVVDGKISMAKYREAEKRHNAKLYSEVKQK
jgi:hypothetical protein